MVPARADLAEFLVPARTDLAVKLLRTSKNNSGLVSKGGVKLLVLGFTGKYWVL